MDWRDVVTDFIGIPQAVAVWGMIGLMCAVPVAGAALVLGAVWLAVTGG